MADEFRYQNSINLSLGLIAAACAILAAAVTAFFSMADKIPHTRAGVLLLLTCILTLLFCTASVVFGGRGISATLKAAQAQTADHYDKGNFNRQAVLGGFGVLAVVGMLMLSLAIKGEQAAERPKTDPSAPIIPAEIAGHLAALDSRISELSQRIDHLTLLEDTLAKDVADLKNPPPSHAAVRREGRSTP
jgi:hypothetical protein